MDAKAASWVGSSTIVTMLREQNDILGPLLNADLRLYQDAELTSRINMLLTEMVNSGAP